MTPLFRRLSPFLSPARDLLIYVTWTWTVQWILLSLVTYALISKNTPFQEINDTYLAFQLGGLGVGAFLLYLVYHRFQGMTGTWQKSLSLVSRGAARGLFVALLLGAGFMVSGYFKFLGSYIEADELFSTIAAYLVRLISLVLLVYSEEYFFRYRIFQSIRQETSLPIAIFATSLCFVLTKQLQFDIGILQSMTLFLASVLLCLRFSEQNHFQNGAGYWAATLAVPYVFLSLPIFGLESAAIWTLKYTPPAQHESLARWLTGGLGGPLSSLGFQFLITLEIGFLMWRQKKLLFSH